MRKVVYLLTVLVFLSLTASAATYEDLSIEKNVSMFAPSEDYAKLSFNYRGDVSGDVKDPFVLKVNITGNETEVTEDNFDLSGTLRTDSNYSLQCGEKTSDFRVDWELDEFYKNSVSPYQGNSGIFYCFPNSFYPLRALDDRGGEMWIKFEANPLLKPDNFTVNYTFTAPDGRPSFDPTKPTTGENNSVEFNEGQFKVLSDEPANYSMIGYSDIYVAETKPTGEDFSTAYFDLRPDKVTGSDLRFNYDEEEFESRELEDPRIYMYDRSNNDWRLLEDQSSGNGLLNARLDSYGLFGVFTSKKTEKTVETETVGGGGGTTVVTETETETEVVNNTRVETALKPTASFDIVYTSPDIRENVRFNASDSYDPDGEIEAYEWSFGKQGEVVEASFPENRSVNVTLTVTDSQGAQDSTIKSLNSEIEEDSSEEIREDIERQETPENITGQFLGSPTNIAGILAAMILAVIGAMVYTGRIKL